MCGTPLTGGGQESWRWWDIISVWQSSRLNQRKATKTIKPLKSLRAWELIGAKQIGGIAQIGSDTGTMVEGLSFNIYLSSSELEVLKSILHK